MKSIKSINDVERLITESGCKLFGVGGLPVTRSEIYPFVDNYELICANKSGETDSVSEKCKVVFFDIKNNPGTKVPGYILEDEKVIEYIKNNSQEKEVAIYTMKAAEQLSKICNENDWKLLANDVDICEKLDNRNTFSEILEKIGWNREFEFVKIAELEGSIKRMFDKFGDKIVIQTVADGGGRGTFFIEKGSNVEKFLNEIKIRLEGLKHECTELIVSKFIEGPVIGAMACATKNNGILTAYPRYQLIDIKEALGGKTDGQGVFCGHDWFLSNELPEWVLMQVDEILRKIGEEIRDNYNHKGIFGVDFIIDEEVKKVVPLELNPRILGSFPQEVQVQLEKNEVPLVAFHLLEMLNIDYKIENERVYKKDFNNVGAHLLLFNFFGKDIKFKEGLQGGVYKIENGEMVFVRNGVELGDIQDVENEFVITGGVPVKGAVRNENKCLFKIVTKRAISEKKATRLNDWGREVVRIVKDEVGREV